MTRVLSEFNASVSGSIGASTEATSFVSAQARHRFERRFWLEAYPVGVPPEIGSLTFDSLIEYVDDFLDRFRHRAAFVSQGIEKSYGDIKRYSENFACYLQSLGVKKGDRIAIMLPNIVQFPACVFGALKAGAIVTLVNPMYTARELEHQLKDSAATVIVIFENFAHVLAQVIDNTQIKHVVTTQFGDLFSDGVNLRGRFVNAVIKHLKHGVPKYQLTNCVPLRHALYIGAHRALLPVNHALDDVALLQYTGGTSGPSKGAMLTNRSLLSNVQQGLEWIRPAVGEGRYTILTALPLYHIYSFTTNCLAYMALGCRNILIANPRDISRFVKQIQGEKIAVFAGVNTLFNALLNNDAFCRRDFSSLKLTCSGGMPLHRSVAERWFELTRVPIIEGYGMTEASPVITVCPLHGADIPVFSGSVGLPLPSTEIRIRRDDGYWADIDESGEIYVRGPQLMKGYWQQSEQTNMVTTADGWFATGDIGVMDRKGYLKIVDRKKDIIVVSGFKVFPSELEDVVAKLPGVKEVGAVGVPDEITGEQIKLCVVKRHPDITEADIRAHCRQNLTGYKVPKTIEFWSELPKSNVGKVLRRKLHRAII